jgi:L-2-hydroxyglutarate oxidase
MPFCDYTIIGGGIVGLAAAWQLGVRRPGTRIVLLEKEPELALHQTGRNSGVIHSGIYYKPGSFKARFAKAGAESMVDFCRHHDIPHDVCGKVIVATEEAELAPLEKLFQRGVENEIPVERLVPEQVAELEPHVRCLAAIHVKSTGITGYRLVAQTYARLIEAAGGTIVRTTMGEFEAKFVVNCAGLHSDRVARMAGVDPKTRIVPFRGEYFELVPEKRHLVKSLIYPVPNPDFPFLGVHFTRMIDGSVHAGPNAVLAFAREGYRKRDLRIRDLAETLAFRGFRKLAWRHTAEGMKEFFRSCSKAAFTRSLQRLIPEVQADDLMPCAAGVRAQAITDSGELVDDFLFVPKDRMLHVLNTPSPAATASIEIGKEIAKRAAD